MAELASGRRWAWPVVAWTLIGVLGVILYVPLLPPIVLSILDPVTGDVNFGAYGELARDDRIVSALRVSITAAILTACITPPLALLGAMGVRQFRIRRTIVGLMILPLFIPAVSIGLSTAIFFRMMGLQPSLLSIVLVHVVWALPFAFLFTLAAMATFDPVYLEAAFMQGANPLRAFLDIEFPLIRPGVVGAAMISGVLSLNETIRTTSVQGGRNTLPTFIWATYRQIGVSGRIHALMALLVVVTLIGVVSLILIGRRWVNTDEDEAE